jgi:hypothetical protein
MDCSSLFLQDVSHMAQRAYFALIGSDPITIMATRVTRTNHVSDNGDLSPVWA